MKSKHLIRKTSSFAWSVNLKTVSSDGRTWHPNAARNFPFSDWTDRPSSDGHCNILTNGNILSSGSAVFKGGTNQTKSQTSEIRKAKIKQVWSCITYLGERVQREQTFWIHRLQRVDSVIDEACWHPFYWERLIADTRREVLDLLTT